MKITLLGTGNALVTEVYNTCYVLTTDDEQRILVDGGGGSEILARLKHADIDINDIHDVIVTHKHIDHLLGIIWVIRIMAQNMKAGKYEGDAYFYAHRELIDQIVTLCDMLLVKKQTAYIGDRIHLIPVTDGETKTIAGETVTFFDLHSDKDKQYGYCITRKDGSKITCCGDEPCPESAYPYAEGAIWLFHEAFCLYSQADIFKPYEKNHSTVKDAAELAQSLHVQNLLLYHSEDKNIKRRKELYTAEGKQYFTGGLYVPEDMEEIEL